MDTLQIHTPCHESWEKMSRNHEGRHCASCAKTVVDVTAMAPGAAREYLSKELPTRLGHGERICVRAHADRSGRLLRPGVTRRLLTNGLAGMLAIAAAGFAGFGPALSAADGGTNPPQQGEPLSPRQGAPVLVEKVMMGKIAMPAAVPPVTDPATAMTVSVDPATFLLIATDASGKEAWRVDLTTRGIPGDMAHWPRTMSLVGQTVVVVAGDMSAALSVIDGTAQGMCGDD